MTVTSGKKFLDVLSGQAVSPPPVWMMRQAGRHLPEYLETRSRARDFLDFCYTPSLAAEATLQPVRRYGMDAAILFADILLILDAMGLGVTFEKGEGPLVEVINKPSDLQRVKPQAAADKLSPVYETVSRVKAELPPSCALIGFAGSPWTVTLYAVEGRGKTDKSMAWRWAHGRPDDLAAAMDLVGEATAHYLARQVEAGADALMLFDSWAEGLPDNIFEEVIIAPTKKLVARLRGMGVTVPIIGFPRGAGVMVPDYVAATGVTGVGLDTAALPKFINSTLPPNFPVQGHLDPLLLIEGGARLDARVDQLLDAYRGRPHIFNLGHGVRPETPIANVERVLARIPKRISLPMGRKIAVVLFNLGGPDKPASVQPFLKNLFRDPAIIRAPLPIRWLLARLISRTRAPAVIKNYAMMDAGGGSPLLRETELQARALEAELAKSLPADEVKCFIAMRYWHPFTEEAAADVKRWGADDVVLLPLYPQFSTTTTGSSLSAWKAAFKGQAKTVCCYPFDENFVSAHVDRIMDGHRRAGEPGQVTLLLSAHGLPEQVVREGDPYQWQCEALAEMIAGRVPAHWEVIPCYQSRVGPLKWIGPATEAEVERAAKAKKHILIAPIAFVSEHIETLVELGEEYRLVAEADGAASYTRVEALGTHPGFIRTLADETVAALGMKSEIRSCAGGRLCPSDWTGCPHAVTQQKAGERVVEQAL